MTKELLQQALDALTRLSFLGNGDFPGNSEGNRIAQKAVSDIKQALAQQEPSGPATPEDMKVYKDIADGYRRDVAQQEQPSDSEYARGFADGQKEFAEIAGGAWQTAVIDQLVVHHIYQAVHDTDPRKAIHDLLCISNDIALDPQVSSDAQALVDRGRGEVQQEQPAQEPVMYQYRWTNPGDNKDVPEFELDWKTVEPRNPNTDTIESRIKELEGYRYNGKPCYEVRALFAAPPTQPAQEPVTRPEPFKIAIPPPMADAFEVVFAEGWNACCDEFFGGKAPPTQPVLSDEQILDIFNKVSADGIGHYMTAVGRAIEAHCRGGATS